MGLNTIETYVAWNAHAPSPDSFRLDGGLDLGRFLDLVAAEGMHAIVRPGPYICAEWTNGGLPAWVLSESGIRRNDPTYMAAVAGYLAALAPVLVPRQADRGGPVILVQVENEYGAYGSDKDYLRALAKLLRAGASVNIYMFHGGTNFGLTSGANDKGTYAPITTSYDYDAPLDEAGNPTAKYWAFRDVLAKYAPVPAERPSPAVPAPAFSSPVAQVVPLWTVVQRLGAWRWCDDPVSADELGPGPGAHAVPGGHRRGRRPRHPTTWPAPPSPAPFLTWRLPPISSSAPLAWAKGSPGSTGSASADTGRADRSEHCMRRGRLPGRMGTS